MAKKYYTGRNSRHRSNVYSTPYGNYNLARKSDVKKLQRVIVELKRTTDALTRRDMADWRKAWQMAINVDNPSRQRLYDIYNDVQVDNHLSGCIDQRVGFVMSRSFKLVDAAGKENTQALHYFDQAWFKDLAKYCLEATYWGHSLIELGDVVTDGDGCPTYSGVSLIPRKHVIPEKGRIVENVGDSWTDGHDYRQAPLSQWVIEAGRPDSLGLFLKAATQTIPKKNVLAFWDSFSEIFGMPMRVAKTSTRDRNEWNRLQRMMDDAGHNLAIVTGMDTEVSFVESGKGDAYNVYDKRVDRANSELSKLTIGQTMTIEDGSSLSQSETHLRVFENLVDSDRDNLRDIVNNQLIPRMVAHGFPVKGLRFEWDDAVDYTPEQQVAYETMIADRYEVDPEYFANKYGMPVGKRINIMSQMQPDGAPSDGESSGKKTHAGIPRNFFD